MRLLSEAEQWAMDRWKRLGALARRLSADYLRNSREAVGLWLAERIHQQQD
jgi:hypothetical protein